MGRSRENKLSLLSTPNFEAFCIYNADFMHFRGEVVNENLFKNFNNGIQKCVFMNQIHSNIAQIYDENYEKDENLRRCDALVCDKKGIALCVLSADCLPLLLWHKSGIILALHSGRVGCFLNILEQSVLKAKELFNKRLNEPKNKDFNFKNEDFALIIAPGICAKNYEISGEVLELAQKNFKPFLEQNHLNLKALVKDEAKKLGITEIKDCAICSFEDERFYSYRRDKTSKRFVSVIYLKA